MVQGMGARTRSKSAEGGSKAGGQDLVMGVKAVLTNPSLTGKVPQGTQANRASGETAK